MVRYRNTRTGEVVEILDPQPFFETSSRWERVEDEKPKSSRRRSSKDDDGDE